MKSFVSPHVNRTTTRHRFLVPTPGEVERHTLTYMVSLIVVVLAVSWRHKAGRSGLVSSYVNQHEHSRTQPRLASVCRHGNNGKICILKIIVLNQHFSVKAQRSFSFYGHCRFAHITNNNMLVMVPKSK